MTEHSNNLIKLVYTSETDSEDNKYFYWNIHFQASSNILDQIREVVYTLHPTFSKREVRAENRDEGFRLVARGWGTFKLKIEIVSKDNKKMRMDYFISRKPTEEITKSLEF